MISPESIKKVKETAEIIEVIGDFLNLKRKGKDYWAPCPFHGEKTPSFSVAPQKGIYKCFGCGVSGDSVKFIMEIERISFIEAIKVLAKKYNIELEEIQVSEEKKEEATLIESLYVALNFAKNFYSNQLWETETGKTIGLSYFKERGFADETIKKFELGFAPDTWDSFLKAAEKQQFNDEVLEKAGLITIKEPQKKFDRFRGRVIFPIHNVSGRTIAFGARILTNDKNQPKYINTNETEVYVKSNVLYGFFQAKNAIRNKDLCYLVEGYTDVISMHEAGVENVVASSGTSFTNDQAKLIFRFTKNVTVLFDGDQAGIKASLRGINILLENDLNVRVCTFPDGH
ncbi:MAG: DNA primase, partial [Cytophagales bacterium]